jgi:glycosyltransferase involved in cell wall biosynthesis
MINSIVSIIMPVYNRAELLPETLVTISDQTYKNWELIIVDDGSTDNSIEIITSFKDEYPDKVKILSSLKKKSGAAACRNIGIKAASGVYILFLDSDDFLASYCLEQRVKALVENPTIDVAVFLMGIYNTEDSKFIDEPYNKQVPINESLYYFLSGINPWNVTCPIWKKEKLLELNGFDEDFYYMEDPELHSRLLMNKDIIVVPFYHLKVDSYYRINNIDLTKSNFYYNSIKYRLLFYKKYHHNIVTGCSKLFKISYKKGLVKLFKIFLISRINEYPNFVKEFNLLVSKSSGFSIFEIFIINLLIYLSKNNNKLIELLKIRGLLYRLI